ncbi:MAG TPA: hypothetical protein VFS43_13635 [Polyangiaceae bacterium]|nr:hypothetical protein [Polyangiaceae bacterium]
MERRCYSVLGLLVLGACVVLGSGCGNKKEDSPTSETASTATLTPEATAPPAITVPPPTPVIPPPAATPTPTPAKTAEKSDPNADANAVVACCNALRREAGKAKTPVDKSKINGVRSTCSDMSIRVRRGELPRDKAFAAIKAAGSTVKLPSECN